MGLAGFLGARGGGAGRLMVFMGSLHEMKDDENAGVDHHEETSNFRNDRWSVISLGENGRKTVGEDADDQEDDGCSIHEPLLLHQVKVFNDCLEANMNRCSRRCR